jgi:hypothetical protein
MSLKLAVKKHKKYQGVMPPYRNDVTNFKVLTRGMVDGELWLTVQVRPDIGIWIRSQPEKMWQEHIDQRWYTVANTFDVHEKIYSLLALTWS